MSQAYHSHDEVDKQARNFKLLFRLLRYVQPYRGNIIAAIVLLLCASLLDSAVPMLTMRTIDAVINNPAIASPDSQSAGVAGNARHAELIRMVCIIGVLMLMDMIVRCFQVVIVVYVSQKAMMAMRLGVFTHLQGVSLRYLDKNPVGRLMTRVTDDVEKLQESIVAGMVEVFNDAYTFVVVLGFMFYVNWQLTLVTLIAVPFIALTSIVFGNYARRSYLDIRKRIARVNSHLQETISGIRVVQIFGREQRNFEAFSALNAEHRDAWTRQVRNYAIYFPVVDFLATSTTALIILYGGHQILNGYLTGIGIASIGMFFAYVQWAERLFGPIRALADRYNLLLEAMASSERVFTLLDTQPDVQDKDNARSGADIRGDVAFSNVFFAYDEEKWVLKDIKLSISPGERVAIVGHTGAGKTTLASLLSRFYDVQRGSIRVDGVDVRDYEQNSLRRQIGVVLQDVFLFSGSIDYNIRLGDPNMSEETVRACAEYVNAAKFIDKLPGGYSYDVGERGCNLSAGQRQLLAFARTLAHNPRILVLDEATSSVDSESEALIQDAIEKLLEGRTSIVIAHRLSTVQHADRIIVMHHGEVREMGSHQELLAKRGLYYTLYRLQYQDQNNVA
jgi:ATP-binding cassette subfamily B multidrug efflux pump